MKHIALCGAIATGALLGWLRPKGRPAKSSANDGKRRVVLAVTGSVAAVKCPDIVEGLLQHGVYVDVVFTESGLFFQNVEYKGVKPSQKLAGLVGRRDEHGAPLVVLWTDADEWLEYKAVGNPVVHVNLAKRNQLLLFAPLDANTLHKLSAGESSNLVSCVARAWYWCMDPQFEQPISERCGSYAMSRPVVVAPSMNTYMWHQEVTQRHIRALGEMGARVVPPVAKELACGDVGMGAMAVVDNIVKRAIDALEAWEAQRDDCVARGKPLFEA